MNDPTPPNILFHVKNIKKDFKNGSGIHFKGNVTLCKGGITFITGKNGIGKSTLLNILGLLDHADLSSDGELVYHGHDKSIDYKPIYKKKLLAGLFDPTAQVRRKYFGFLPQAGHLIDVLTVRENLLAVENLKGQRTDKGKNNGNEDVLKRMFSYDMAENTVSSEHINKSPANLSGGYRQRLALARAIMCEPYVIFADEPTNNMDEDVIALTIKSLGEFVEKKGGSVIMVAHGFMNIWEKSKKMFPNIRYDRLEVASSYKLNESSLDKLKKAGIPKYLINGLDKIKNMEYSGWTNFIKAMERAMNKSITKADKSLLSKYLGMNRKWRDVEIVHGRL